MNKELVQFSKLMQSGLSIRLTIEDTLEMVSKSQISNEFKEFALKALTNKKERAIGLGESMSQSSLFPPEFSFAVEKTQHYFIGEFAKTFEAFADYFKELDQLNNSIKISKSA